jgi:hypothetical protein
MDDELEAVAIDPRALVCFMLDRKSAAAFSRFSGSSWMS